MQQDKDMAWKEFEQTGNPVSYLAYRGIAATVPATAQTKDDSLENTRPKEGSSLN